MKKMEIIPKVDKDYAFEKKNKKEYYCDRHKEHYKYTPFGFYCVSCYNENLIEMRNKGLIK